MNTYMANAQNVERKWYVVDADGMVLGRLASQVANILRGKNKPIYTPHVDTGDHVIIINASKIVMTGKKLDQKIYYHHSGYAGGLKEIKYQPITFLIASITRSAWKGLTMKSFAPDWIDSITIAC